MKELINFIGKLSVCLLVLIAIEAIGLLAGANPFDLSAYTWIGYVVQILLFFLCVWIADGDWEVNN
jgi:hypothetical protein